MSIEKLWISSPPWQRWCSTAITMMDVHSIASTGQSCSLITVRYIYCCCQYHHSFHWLIVFVYWCCFKSSGCCGCYCLLRPADWPVDCWSTSVFLLLPLCFAIAMATCCVARAVADDVLSKMGNAMLLTASSSSTASSTASSSAHHRSSSNVFLLTRAIFRISPCTYNQ